MLRSRLSVCLLINEGALVKSTKFKNFKYVGDPLNAVRIFNELNVDELIILDISATRNNKPPDFDLISNISSQCRMPLCYGGGIKDINTIVNLISLGIEKVALGSSCFMQPNLIKQASEIVGSQSVVAVIDVARTRFTKRLICRFLNGKKDSRKDPLEAAKLFTSLGAGEILLQSIDNDGTLKGFDRSILESVKKELNYPITVLGGASSYENIKEISDAYGPLGVSAGSVFVFEGIHKAVLINYPAKEEKILMTTPN